MKTFNQIRNVKHFNSVNCILKLKLQKYIENLLLLHLPCISSRCLLERQLEVLKENINEIKTDNFDKKKGDYKNKEL